MYSAMLLFVVAYLQWARVLDSYGFLFMYSYFTVAMNIIVINKSVITNTRFSRQSLQFQEDRGRKTFSG